MNDAEHLLARAFADANALFHEAYGEARQSAHEDVPLFIVLAQEIVLHAGSERRAFPFDSPAFHVAKTAAHIAVALYTTGGNSPGQPLGSREAERLASLERHLQDATRLVCGSGQELNGASGGALTRLLDACVAFAAVLRSQRLAEPGARAEFATSTGALILELTEIATREQITVLDAAVERALFTLSNDQRARLQVVVVGDHQARNRNLGMQYFQTRLCEAEGSDERVTYGENLSDEQQALELVGTRRLDRAVARAFFGDEKRLQRDVLGDAAKACLDSLRLAPIR